MGARGLSSVLVNFQGLTTDRGTQRERPDPLAPGVWRLAAARTGQPAILGDEYAGSGRRLLLRAFRAPAALYTFDGDGVAIGGGGAFRHAFRLIRFTLSARARQTHVYPETTTAPSSACGHHHGRRHKPVPGTELQAKLFCHRARGGTSRMLFHLTLLWSDWCVWAPCASRSERARLANGPPSRPYPKGLAERGRSA